MPCCGGPVPCHDDDEAFLAQAPGQDDILRFGDETVACGDCAASISDGAERCPLCGAMQIHDSDIRDQSRVEGSWPFGRVIALATALVIIAAIVLL